MPSSCAARTTRRNASTPRRWPSARGRPRAAAQRPLPSMMIATCEGPSVRSGPSVAGAAAFDIGQSQEAFSSKVDTSACEENASKQREGWLNGEDFRYLGRQQLIELGNDSVGRLLHVVGQAFLIVLGNLVI